MRAPWQGLDESHPRQLVRAHRWRSKPFAGGPLGRLGQVTEGNAQLGEDSLGGPASPGCSAKRSANSGLSRET